jgi:hypothetical protein
MTAFLVKWKDKYVAFPNAATYRVGLDSVEWTEKQGYAWRWVGLESGNGARLTARKVGNGARVVRLRPRSTSPKVP